MHFFADGLEELIGLLGREDERTDGVSSFEGRDIEEGVFFKDASSHQKAKEAPGNREHMVDRGGLRVRRLVLSCEGKKKGEGRPDPLHSDADNDQSGGDDLCRAGGHTRGLPNT